MHIRPNHQLLYSVVWIVFSVFVFCQCGNIGEINKELDLAEELLKSRPDSSYFILETIDTLKLNSRRVSARYSLLKAMAIDKMGIDTTNLNIIQPAVDYYIKNGNADEKLRTYYYLGRIYQNQKDYESALSAFIHGKELLPHMTDSLVMGQLLIAESAILNDIPNYEQMLSNRIKAAELFDGIGRRASEIQSWAAALDLCVSINNKTRADSIYNIVSSLLIYYPEYKSIAAPYILSYLITYGSSDVITKAVQDAENLDIIDEWTAKDISVGYNAIGNDVMALQWLDSIPEDGKVITTPMYYLLKADILEGLGDYKGALEAHRKLLEIVENNHESTSKQDIYFARKRYETEIENLNAIRKRERVIWVAIIAGVILLFNVVSIFRRYRTTRNENRRQMKEIEQLRRKHEKALKENESLQSETEVLQTAKTEYQTKLRRERQEKEQLQEAMRITEEERLRLEREKEAAREAKESAERELSREREELENYRTEKNAAEEELAKEREELATYRVEKEKAEAELATVRHEKEILEQERQSQKESMERMKSQIRDMEEQTAQLNELLNRKQTMAPEVEKAIRDRLRLLHGMLATHISRNDKLAAKFIAERDKIINDKEGFMNATRLAYKASHPGFISYLEERGLTESEINYACLYAMGMNGKEVGGYLQDSRHYHVSSDIRRKLGLPENATNLSIYIRKLLS